MRYSSVAPFILDAADCPHVGPILYCSSGVPFHFPPEKTSAIRAAFESAAFVYVRDFQSRAKLQAAGVSRRVEVAPDLIVTLGDFFNRDAERSRGLTLLAGHGVDTTKDIICFQSSPQSPDDVPELLQQLAALKEKTGAEIVLVPIGHCHGDDVFLRQLAEKSGGALTYIAVHSIFEIISVIAASRLFIGTSMHGNITAFSFGIPHLFGPIAVDKAEGFLEISGLGNDFKLRSWSQLAGKEAMVMRLPQNHFADKAATAKKAVHATLKKMLKILRAPAPQQYL
jgi:polysaccharide pyruvyl transferase WcaK-like protein